jgi:hypothetical protein
MKTKRTYILVLTLLGFAILMSISASRITQQVEATSLMYAPAPVATPTPCLDGLVCYHVLPSETDGPNNDGSDPCSGMTGPGIGCDASDQWDLAANNDWHQLYLPPKLTDEGKLLVFLCGGHGKAEPCENVFPVAARQGYHVVGLTYPAIVDACSGLPAEEKYACFTDVLRETVTGDDASNKTDFHLHRQDSIVNRLINVLKWADDQNDEEGWGKYLNDDGDDVDWTKVNLAGFSNGSTHVSFMGTQIDYQDVGRVTLFAGPNDGHGPSTDWHHAPYIQHVPGMTDARYYGLVHYLNNADGPLDDVLYKVFNNWHKFEMDVAPNAPAHFFNPTPGDTYYFGDSHMLISLDEYRAEDNLTDLGTTAFEAHPSVVKDVYCIESEPDEPDHPDKLRCKTYGTAPIGYQPAWRCVLGTGDRYASDPPIANAGPAQVVECQGNGGATIYLDGSLSRDYDCEPLRYVWQGLFGQRLGKNPSLFLSLGPHIASLVVSDPWQDSLPSSTLISVVDTTPPSLQVSLTPTVLWPANHSLIRIDATVSASDSCGGGPVQVVLSSVTSDQPDNATGDGDAPGDIQGAAFETFDRSFFLRAERAGGDPIGRTYTVTYTATDGSGNKTARSATVHVPHSRPK